MAETIPLRWWGPSDATNGSRYRIARCTENWGEWVELVAAKPATAPYVSPSAVLAQDVTAGDADLPFVDADSLASSGYMWLGGCLVQWTSKLSDTLNGCVWHSGHGVIRSGTVGHQAHESYTDTGVVPTKYAVVYRITHIDALDHESPPAYAWWHYPPPPESDEMCVIIFSVGEDFGIDPQRNVTIQGELTTDDQYSVATGQHLDQRAGANQQVTNELGLAHFQCRRSDARRAKGGGPATSYKFVINTAREPLTVHVDDVPPKDWVRAVDVWR